MSVPLRSARTLNATCLGHVRRMGIAVLATNITVVEGLTNREWLKTRANAGTLAYSVISRRQLKGTAISAVSVTVGTCTASMCTTLT
jgi:hypothetical protein